MSDVFNTSWPRCVICGQIITKGFNEDRVRNVISDPDGQNIRHVFDKDCLLSPIVFNKEEVDIVY